MKQTLTTEQLRARAKFWREKAVEAKWESVSIAQDMLLNADAFEELAANREAQPVGYIAEVSGNRVGVLRGLPLPDVGSLIYTAPPAPAVPDEIISAIRHLKDTLVACNRFNYCSDAVNRVENACRAAMLAAAPEGGNG